MVTRAVDRIGGSATDRHEAVDREERVENRSEECGRPAVSNRIPIRAGGRARVPYRVSMPEMRSTGFSASVSDVRKPVDRQHEIESRYANGGRPAPADRKSIRSWQSSGGRRSRFVVKNAVDRLRDIEGRCAKGGRPAASDWKSMSTCRSTGRKRSVFDSRKAVDRQRAIGFRCAKSGRPGSRHRGRCAKGRRIRWASGGRPARCDRDQMCGMRSTGFAASTPRSSRVHPLPHRLPSD